MPPLSGAAPCGGMPCRCEAIRRESPLRLCESAQCRCLACPHYAAAPRAVSLPCAIAMPSLPRRSVASLCGAMPQQSDSMRLLAHALRIGAMPRLGYAVPQHCRAMADAEVRPALPMRFRAVRCRSITELISASAAHSKAPAAPCQTSPPRFIAPLWLAAAIHGLTVPCRCPAGQCLAYAERVSALLFHRFTGHRRAVALRPTGSHCLRPAQCRFAAALLDALPTLCAGRQSRCFAQRGSAKP